MGTVVFLKDHSPSLFNFYEGLPIAVITWDTLGTVEEHGPTGKVNSSFVPIFERLRSIKTSGGFGCGVRGVYGDVYPDNDSDLISTQKLMRLLSDGR